VREHWLSNHLNAYLQDDDEYRAITRQTIIRGLAGTITFTPAAITVQLEQPGAPRITRALALLLDEINQAPPRMPGDRRPVTYHLAAPRRHLTPGAAQFPEFWALDGKGSWCRSGSMCCRSLRLAWAGGQRESPARTRPLFAAYLCHGGAVLVIEGVALSVALEHEAGRRRSS
jgi:hypothetical protein